MIRRIGTALVTPHRQGLLLAGVGSVGRHMTSTHLSLPARLVTSPLSAPLAFLGGSFCRLADRYFLKQGFWETDPESPGEFQIPGTHVREGTVAHRFECYGVPQSLNIQYFERMAEGARVCYIAGLGSNGRIDDAFLDALHAKGLATYALNLPDAGESGGMRNHEGQAFAWSDIKANPREYSQGILRPLIATLNAINHDGRDLYLVGHSLGAGTVLGLAASGKVRGLKGVIPLCVASSDGEAAHVHWYIRSIAALATDAGASYGRRFIKWISGIRNLHDRNFVPTSFALSLTLLATHFVVSHFTSQSFSRKAAKRMTAASILPHWIDPTITSGEDRQRMRSMSQTRALNARLAAHRLAGEGGPAEMQAIVRAVHENGIWAAPINAAEDPILEHQRAIGSLQRNVPGTVGVSLHFGNNGTGHLWPQEHPQLAADLVEAAIKAGGKPVVAALDVVQGQHQSIRVQIERHG